MKIFEKVWKYLKRFEKIWKDLKRIEKNWNKKNWKELTRGHGSECNSVLFVEKCTWILTLIPITKARGNGLKRDSILSTNNYIPPPFHSVTCPLLLLWPPKTKRGKRTRFWLSKWPKWAFLTRFDAVSRIFNAMKTHLNDLISKKLFPYYGISESRHRK